MGKRFRDDDDRLDIEPELDAELDLAVSLASYDPELHDDDDYWVESAGERNFGWAGAYD